MRYFITTYWTQIQFLLSTIIIAWIFKRYDSRTKKNEVRYAEWYKSKLQLISSFNRAYLVALLELKHLQSYVIEGPLTQDHIQINRKNLIEVHIAAFALESYVDKDEGDPITGMLSAFVEAEEKLNELPKFLVLEWIEIFSKIEINASNFQKIIRKKFLD